MDGGQRRPPLSLSALTGIEVCGAYRGFIVFKIRMTIIQSTWIQTNSITLPRQPRN